MNRPAGARCGRFRRHAGRADVAVATAAGRHGLPVELPALGTRTQAANRYVGGPVRAAIYEGWGTAPGAAAALHAERHAHHTSKARPGPRLTPPVASPRPRRVMLLPQVRCSAVQGRLAAAALEFLELWPPALPGCACSRALLACSALAAACRQPGSRRAAAAATGRRHPPPPAERTPPPALPVRCLQRRVVALALAFYSRDVRQRLDYLLAQKDGFVRDHARELWADVSATDRQPYLVGRRGPGGAWQANAMQQRSLGVCRRVRLPTAASRRVLTRPAHPRPSPAGARHQGAAALRDRPGPAAPRIGSAELRADARRRAHRPVDAAGGWVLGWLAGGWVLGRLAGGWVLGRLLPVCRQGMHDPPSRPG